MFTSSHTTYSQEARHDIVLASSVWAWLLVSYLYLIFRCIVPRLSERKACHWLMFAACVFHLLSILFTWISNQVQFSVEENAVRDWIGNGSHPEALQELKQDLAVTKPGAFHSSKWVHVISSLDILTLPLRMEAQLDRTVTMIRGKVGKRILNSIMGFIGFSMVILLALAIMDDSAIISPVLRHSTAFCITTISMVIVMGSDGVFLRHFWRARCQIRRVTGHYWSEEYIIASEKQLPTSGSKPSSSSTSPKELQNQNLPLFWVAALIGLDVITWVFCLFDFIPCVSDVSHWTADIVPFSGMILITSIYLLLKMSDSLAASPKRLIKKSSYKVNQLL